MQYAIKSKLTTMAGVVLVAGALVAPGTSLARSWEVRDFSDGGFEIEFSNGCTVTYDRYGERENSTRGCKNKQIRSADETARSHHDSYRESGSDSVPEGQMSRYCQGEASAKLNVRPNYISTDDVERSGNKYTVHGESRVGSDVTTFKCTFDRHGVFKKVDVRSSGSGGNSNSVPEGQMSRYCQGEASAKLDVRPNYISTEDVNRTGNKYIVHGESRVGSDVTTFKCTFNRHGEFRGVDVDRHGSSGYGSSNNGNIPRAAEKRCRDTFGNSHEVTSVSALRPGFWEVIMQARNGPRSVACTVTSSGEIEDWVELN